MMLCRGDRRVRPSDWVQMARSPTDAGMEWIDACCSVHVASTRARLPSPIYYYFLHHNLNDTITPASQCWWSSISTGSILSDTNLIRWLPEWPVAWLTTDSLSVISYTRGKKYQCPLRLHQLSQDIIGDLRSFTVPTYLNSTVTQPTMPDRNA